LTRDAPRFQDAPRLGEAPRSSLRPAPRPGLRPYRPGPKRVRLSIIVLAAAITLAAVLTGPAAGQAALAAVALRPPVAANAALAAASLTPPVTASVALAAAALATPAAANAPNAPNAAAGATGAVPEPVLYTRVYLDGVRVPLPAPAIIAAGRGMAPARALFERLGATVLWDGGRRMLTIQTPAAPGQEGSASVAPGKTIQLRLGENLADVDGRPTPLDAPAFLWGGTSMAPVRFIAETLGLTVEWDPERWAILLARPGVPAAVTQEEVTLAFAGDVLLGSRIGRTIETHGPDYPWDGVREVLSAADIAAVNLENCVSTRGVPREKPWVFRAAPESLAGLKNAGVDLVWVANNHTFDYGLDAFGDTLTYLDQYGILHAGAGQNLAQALEPVIIEAGGLRFAFLAATQWFVSAGVAGENSPGLVITHYHERALRETVSRLKEEGRADYVVVSFHWGIEGEHLASDYQQRLGRTLIDAGADMIIGHHPHLLQGIEFYQDRPIVYSLGNFVFTYTTRATMDSAILLVTVDGQGIAAVRLLPVYTAGGRPVLEGGEDYVRIISEVSSFSEKWGTRIDANGYVFGP